MCPQCQPFGESRTLGSLVEFRLLHTTLLSEGLGQGALKIIEGDLQWDDVIHCELRCATCGQRFVLDCETYHGRGGEWKVT